jgi:membrane protease YdiL (CAAX protease family)
MAQTPAPDASPPAASDRWWLLAAAAAVCTTLYLASTISAYLLSELGGRTLLGAIAGMAAIAALGLVTVRLSSTIAHPGGGVSGAIVGRARSRRVGSAVSAQIAFLLLISPLLVSLGHAVGFRGTTSIALHHRPTAVVLLLTWIAVVVAPWMEEVSMRGFLLSGLWARIGFWPAALASSLVWAALHGVSGVLIPFTVEGIVLCWIRRRTGSTRTGIALHASQNTLASLFSGSGLLVVPAVAGVVVSLVATREGATSPVTRATSRLLERGRQAADALAARATPDGSRPAIWILAGSALLAGVMLEAVSLQLDLGGGTILTAGRIVIAALSLPPLGWLLLSARSAWRAPAAACVAGAAGCLLLIAARVGVLVGTTALVPLVGVGFTLVALGLIGLATAAIGGRARLAAGAAGLLLAATLTPVPYVTTSAHAMVDQSLVVSLAAAAAIVSIGLTLRRPPAPTPDYAWRAAGATPLSEPG